MVNRGNLKIGDSVLVNDLGMEMINEQKESSRIKEDIPDIVIGTVKSFSRYIGVKLPFNRIGQFGNEYKIWLFENDELEYVNI